MYSLLEGTGVSRRTPNLLTGVGRRAAFVPELGFLLVYFFLTMKEKDIDLSRMTRGRDLQAELEANDLPSVVYIELSDECCDAIKNSGDRFKIACASKVTGLYLRDDDNPCNGRPSWRQSPNLKDPAVIFWTEEGFYISHHTFRRRIQDDDYEIWGALQQESSASTEVFDELYIPWWSREALLGATVYFKYGEVDANVVRKWRKTSDSAPQKTPGKSKSEVYERDPDLSGGASSAWRCKEDEAKRARSRTPRRLVPKPPEKPPSAAASSARPDSSVPQHEGGSTKVRGGWMLKCAALVRAIWQQEGWDVINQMAADYWSSGSQEFKDACK